MRGLCFATAFCALLVSATTFANEATRPWVDYFGVNAQNGIYDAFPTVRFPSPLWRGRSVMDGGYRDHMNWLLEDIDRELAKGGSVIYCFRGFGHFYADTNDFLDAVAPKRCSSANWNTPACAGARSFRDWAEDQVKSVHALPHYDASRVYWELGNEINNKYVSNAVHEYSGIRLQAEYREGAAQLWDPAVIKPYVESFFAPLADEILTVDPGARILLGSVANAFREQIAPWVKATAQTVIAGDQQPPGDNRVKGKRVISLIRSVSVHYLVNLSNREGIGSGDAVGLLDDYLAFTQGRGIFVTEEVGQRSAHAGRGGETLVRSIASYLALQQKHDLTPDQLRVALFAWKGYAPTAGTNPLNVAGTLRDIFRDPDSGADPALLATPVDVESFTGGKQSGLHAYAFRSNWRRDDRRFVFIFADWNGMSDNVENVTLRFPGESFPSQQEVRMHYFSADGYDAANGTAHGFGPNLTVRYGTLRRKMGHLGAVDSDAVLLEVLR